MVSPLNADEPVARATAPDLACRSLTSLLALCLLAVLPVPARGQSAPGPDPCDGVTNHAEDAYFAGHFDDAIAALQPCVDRDAIAEGEVTRAYALLGRIYVAKGLEAEARSALRRLLELVPAYRPDPVYERADFVALAESVRQEVEAERDAEREVEAEQPDGLAGAPDDPPAQLLPAQVLPAETLLDTTEAAVPPSPAPPLPVTEEHSERRRRNRALAAIGGGALAVAAGVAVVLLGNGGDRDEDGITDGSDNCPDDHNPDQTDADDDGDGDACDTSGPPLSVITVNRTDDDGDASPGDGTCATSSSHCTLRAALEEANAQTGTGRILIQFDIDAGPGWDPSTGVATIRPVGSPLPEVTRASVTLDAETQPGAHCGDLVAGAPHRLRVVLDGRSVPSTGTGLQTTENALDFIARGFAIQNFSGGEGLKLGGARALVECSYLGTDYAGEVPQPNDRGVLIGTTATDTRVRDTLLSGNLSEGLAVVGDTATLLENLVGTNAQGDARLGNGGDGIYIESDDVVVDGNVVSANGNTGITIGVENGLSQQAPERAVLRNNLVGLSRTGDALGLGNMVEGVILSARDGPPVTGHDIGLPGAGNRIADNGGAGIKVVGASVEGNRIRGNTIGLDGADNAAPNARGVVVIELASANVVGGLATGEANVISGNAFQGVSIQAAGNDVIGNTVGLNAAGAPRPNGTHGICVKADSVVVGGPWPGAGNVVSGNGGEGIRLDYSAGVTIEGNRVGTDSTGTIPLGNARNGIDLHNTRDIVIRGNVSAANTRAGLNLGNSRGVVVESNFFGTDPSSTLDLGNGHEGIFCNETTGSRIGGFDTGNVIAFNGASGIFLRAPDEDGNVCDDVAVLGNIIFANDGLGIDLAPDGVNANDTRDGDDGANGRLNFPLIESAANDGTTTTISFTLDAPPNTTFLVLLCRNDLADPSGHGECEYPSTPVTVTTDADGAAVGVRSSPSSLYPAGSWITALATMEDETSPSGYGDTSEFSAAVQVADAAGAGTASATVDLPREHALHGAAPNPFTTTATLRYDLPESGRIRLVVYDPLGREVAVLAEGEQAAGRYAIQLAAAPLAAGTYVVRLQHERGILARTITVVR
jgi:CSLREA domain-containing protein